MTTPTAKQDKLAFDRASVRSVDGDGHMRVASSIVSAAAVNEYLGAEIPDFEKLGLEPKKLYKLYRHPDELEKGAASLHGKPLMLIHRPQSAEDHDRESVVGSVSNPVWEAPNLKAELTIWDGEAIALIESGDQKSLSAGYLYIPVMTPGTTPNGEAFDGLMTGIEFNHTALVTEPRVQGAVVGDSAIVQLEEVDMSKPIKMTRTGAAVRSVIALHIAPKLAQDAKVDLRPILAKLTAKNFAASKPTIIAGIKTATKGKLAADATIDDVVKIVDALEGAPIADGEEEMDVEEMPEETMDGEGDIHEFLKGKLGEDDFKKACDMLKAGKAADAEGEGETEEEKKRKAKEAEEKMAGDVEEAVKEKTKDMVSKGAMDAAITAAVSTERKRQQDIVDAREEVRPVVGALKGAFDSALGVYQAALGVLGVADADKIDSVIACKAVMKAQKPQGAGPSPAPKIATDAATAKSLAERFPHAAGIKVSAA